MAQAPALSLPPSARSRTAATWALRVCVLGMCAGYAYVLTLRPHDLGLYLKSRHFARTEVDVIQTVAASVLIVLGFVSVHLPTRLVGVTIGVTIGVIIVCSVAAKMDYSATEPWVWMTPASQATRYVAPVALGLIWWSLRSHTGGVAAAVFLLRVAAAATFAAHGVKALYATQPFVALISLTGDNLFGTPIDPVTAGLLLKVIGAVDIICAGLVLVAPWRPVVAWMAFWGFLAAASRMTAHGWTWWPETLVRLPNGGVPLALLCLWWSGVGDADEAAPDED